MHQGRWASASPYVVRPHRLAAAATVVLLAAVPHIAAAQAVTGTILGTVSDSAGGVVPRTVITLVHAPTGLIRSLAADEYGEYVVPLLATGEYLLRAEAAGFKTASISGIDLAVDGKVRVDVTLVPGGVSETVVVTADNALVQRASSDVSATLAGDQIEALPLSDRNFVQLARTLPGVVRGVPGENIDGASSVSWRHSSSLAANGQRNRDNNFLLDGLDNNEVWINSVAVFPGVEALDELKVQTGIYPAEFGRALGAVVSLQTRSGANALRGTAFEFLRNGRFDANDWFNNRAGRPKPEFSFHQFGGALGGPIVRNRTFFFGDYQGLRIDQDLTLVSTVPSDAMRAGDFSELRRTLYDPRTGAPFPGNVIPSDRIDERGAQHHRGAVSAGQHAGTARGERPDHRQLRHQPRAAAERRPVRRQGRPRVQRRQPRLSPLQPAGRLAADSAVAAARRRHRRPRGPTTPTPRASPSTTRTSSARA